MGKSILEEEMPRHIITGRGESETDLEAFDWFKKVTCFLIGNLGVVNFVPFQAFLITEADYYNIPFLFPITRI